MAGIFIGSYSVRVREQGTQEWLPMDFARGASVHKTFRRALQRLTSCRHHHSEPNLLRVTKVEQNATDLWGILERGEYGYTANLVHAKHFTTSHARAVDEAELIPLFFRLHLPATGTTGILILQRLGVHGAFGDLKDALLTEFRDAHPDFILSFARFVPTTILKELREGSVREMSVITHSLPSDITNRLHLKGAKLNVGKLEIRLRAPTEDRLFSKRPQWLKDVASGKARIAEVFGTDMRVRIRVEYKGHERLYDFGRAEQSAPYVDISNEVKKHSDGHPKFQSMKDYSETLRDELLEQLGQDRPS